LLPRARADLLELSADKDLKFIHVFPKIDTAAAAAAAAPGDDDEDGEIKVGGMSLDELPPEHLCAIVSLETFSKLYSKQCTSFSQRRALLKALKELAARIIGFEERMTNMQSLTAAEEELYNTAQDVPDKVCWRGGGGGVGEGWRRGN